MSLASMSLASSPLASTPLALSTWASTTALLLAESRCAYKTEQRRMIRPDCTSLTRITDATPAQSVEASSASRCPA
eukprot:5926985-Pleurochrysis_carterae.AAC.4